jgi:uncharacterized protein
VWTMLLLVTALHSTSVTGHWSGYMQRGSARLSVAFDFPAATPPQGLFSALDLGAIDIPLRNVKLGPTVHWELVGDTTTTTFDGVVNGELMTGGFTEDGSRGTFSLRRISASTQKPYDQNNVTFLNGNVRLAGTLYVPRSAGKHPAVIFIHGSGGEGRWASAYLADYVARHGVVALAYDKRGVGSSTGDWRTSTMEDLVADARAGIDLLAHTPQVDPHRIGLFGHSQGGQLAPAVAADNPEVAWVIDADGPIGPQYLQDLFRVDTALEKRYSGKKLADAETLYAEFVDVARLGAPHDKLRSDIGAVGSAPWLADLAIPDDSSWIWAWYKDNGDYDNRSAWAAVRVPVLIIFGARDELVSPQQSIEQTTSILNMHDTNKVMVRVFADTDHTLHIPPQSPNGWPKLPAGFPDIIATFALQN